MSVLVTGGAGYIGAHVVRVLLAAGEDVVVLDDLSTGRRSVIPDGVRFVEADVRDAGAVSAALRTHSIECVVHLAAKKAVGESVERPLWYYRQNVEGLVSLLEAMQACDVRSLVYSSSSSVYGNPVSVPVRESAVFAPESPYGQTKVVGEWLVDAAAKAWGLSYTSLRYFNVAGAGAPTIGDVGAFNLIPLAMRAISSDEAPLIFGDDYPTRDGTCIRDYVHVVDLAEAHAAAVAFSVAGGAAAAFNVGRGVGSTVREVLAVVSEVTGSTRAPEVVGRRPGDPAELVASAEAIREVLGFEARRDLKAMVESAWEAWPRG